MFYLLQDGHKKVSLFSMFLAHFRVDLQVTESPVAKQNNASLSVCPYARMIELKPGSSTNLIGGAAPRSIQHGPWLMPCHVTKKFGVAMA